MPIALALLFDYKLFTELRETIARKRLRPVGLSPEDPIPQPHTMAMSVPLLAAQMPAVQMETEED